MSKLSRLKQDAYQAGKNRDWDQAVAIYEQILELDKSNPTLINELGDLCLKAGQTASGVKHFLSAASKYRHTGLLNNAVAIYKKILRYDADNMNAHWYLAESRANQGLLMDGAQHALVFLGNQENLTGDIKEIFLKRCTHLFELYPENPEILESLLQVFRMWNLAQESGRTQIQLACLKWDAGEEETAQRMVEETLAQTPELANYPEHSRWMEKQNPGAQPGSAGGFDNVSFDESTPAEAPAKPEIPDTGSVSQVHDTIASEGPSTPVPPAGPVAPAEPVVSAEPVSPAGPVAPAKPVAPYGPDPAVCESVSVAKGKAEPTKEEPDEGGCFNLDMGEGCSFDDLIAQATAGVPDVTSEVEEFPGTGKDSDDEKVLPEGTDVPVPEPSTVNLLDELLAEDSDSDIQESVREEETISEEIGSQLGGANSSDDPSSLYEMGMVYLEMGMHDKACTSFQKASCHAEFAIRALEMWGITLLRGGKVEDAIAVLTEGLDIPEEGSHEYLGLLYHIARAHEQGNNTDEALRLFEMIHDQDPVFLDVGRRVAKLASLT